MAEYIDREKAIVACKFIHGRFDDIYISETAIKNIPAADVKPVVKGKWKWNKFWDYFYCSECGNNVQGNTLNVLEGSYKFCPYCGAKMREEEDE